LVYSNYLFALANFFLDTSTAPAEASPSEARINAKFISLVAGFLVATLLYPTTPYVLKWVVVNTTLPFSNLASKVSTSFPSSSKYTTL